MRAIGILAAISAVLAGTAYVMDTSSVLVGWLLGIGSVAFCYYMTDATEEHIMDYENLDEVAITPSGVADISLVRTPLCKKCNVHMKEGKAFQNQLVGGTRRGATLSHTGPAQMVKVWKCPKCGHSFTK